MQFHRQLILFASLLIFSSCITPQQKKDTQPPTSNTKSTKKDTFKPKGTISTPINKAELALRKKIEEANRIKQTRQNKYNLPDGLYAELNTNKGIIIIKLFYRKAPLTVANFVGLTEGTKYSKREGRPFYDNTIFYHVARNFTVRAGCPKGTGTGSPGYSFPDEFHPSLKHSTAGIVSMANIGPDTNGSQFFFTLKPTPWLDSRNSIFGKVIKGLDVLNKIRKGDKINTLTILRIGDAASHYIATQDVFAKLLKERLKKDGKTMKTKPKNPTHIYQKW